MAAQAQNAFERLVVRYAGNRVVCNCGQAYYTNCGTVSFLDNNGDWQTRNDYPECKNGCDANLERAKIEIAEQVEKEFLLLGKPDAHAPPPNPA